VTGDSAVSIRPLTKGRKLLKADIFSVENPTVFDEGEPVGVWCCQVEGGGWEGGQGTGKLSMPEIG
jgi:hypothetical protein